MNEAEFLAELCRRSGCGVLLDVNNLFVNAANLGWDPEPYLTELDPRAVAYFHVAGHAVLPDVRIDTHDAAVPDSVWALYDRACARFPDAGTVLERDDALPAFDELMGELDHARALHAARASAAISWRAPLRRRRLNWGSDVVQQAPTERRPPARPGRRFRIPSSPASSTRSADERGRRCSRRGRR